PRHRQSGRPPLAHDPLAPLPRPGWRLRGRLRRRERRAAPSEPVRRCGELVGVLRAARGRSVRDGLARDPASQQPGGLRERPGSAAAPRPLAGLPLRGLRRPGADRREPVRAGPAGGGGARRVRGLPRQALLASLAGPGAADAALRLRLVRLAMSGLETGLVLAVAASVA